MFSPNPTAATQGRGFGRFVESDAPPIRRTMRLSRMLLALAVLAPSITGCRTLPTLADDGATARLVAAVGAAEIAPADRLSPATRSGRPLIAAN